MKKIIAVSLLIGVFLVTGCTSTPVIVEEVLEEDFEEVTGEEEEEGEEDVVEEDEPEEEEEEEEDTVVEEEEDKEEEVVEEDKTSWTETVNGTEVTFIEDSGIPELSEGFGIYGSSVELEGVYPGWSGTIPLTLVNGQDRERLFVIYAVSPTRTREGFEAFPEEYLYWITVETPEVTVGKGEIQRVNITFEMPLDVEYAGRFAEVRIRVDDTTQTGLVQIALESKWFIITAE